MDRRPTKGHTPGDRLGATGGSASSLLRGHIRGEPKGDSHRGDAARHRQGRKEPAAGSGNSTATWHRISHAESAKRQPRPAHRTAGCWRTRPLGPRRGPAHLRPCPRGGRGRAPSPAHRRPGPAHRAAARTCRRTRRRALAPQARGPNLRRPTSDVRGPTSDARGPTSKAQHATSDLRGPTCDVRPDSGKQAGRLVGRPNPPSGRTGMAASGGGPKNGKVTHTLPRARERFQPPEDRTVQNLRPKRHRRRAKPAGLQAEAAP